MRFAGDAYRVLERDTLSQPYDWPDWTRYRRAYLRGLVSFWVFSLFDIATQIRFGDINYQDPVGLSRLLVGTVILGLTIAFLLGALQPGLRFEALAWSDTEGINRVQRRADLLRQLGGVSERTAADFRRTQTAAFVLFLIFVVWTGILVYRSYATDVPPSGVLIPAYSLWTLVIISRFLWISRKFGKVLATPASPVADPIETARNAGDMGEVITGTDSRELWPPSWRGSFGMSPPVTATNASVKREVSTPRGAEGHPLPQDAREADSTTGSPRTVFKPISSLLSHPIIRWTAATIIAAVIQVYVARFLS